MFSEEELKRCIQTKLFGSKLYVCESVDSTNTYAKTLAAKGADEGTVVIADHQTAGRGRFNRTWHAEAGTNLLFSLIIRPTLSKEKIGLLPFFSAAGTALAVEAIAGKNCECKWPNDIFLNGKKCCGILLESSFQKRRLEHVIIGIGLNVNQQKFEGGLNNTATSLRKECGTTFERAALFCRIMSSLESFYAKARTGDFSDVLTAWKARASMLGKSITLTQGDHRIVGTAAGLSPDGGLIVETKTGQRVFHAGDVTLIQ